MNYEDQDWMCGIIIGLFILKVYGGILG